MPWCPHYLAGPSRDPEDGGGDWVHCIRAEHVAKLFGVHATMPPHVLVPEQIVFTSAAVTIGVNLNISGLMNPQPSTTGVDAREATGVSFCSSL